MDEEMKEKFDQVMKSVLITLNPRIDDYLLILSPFFSKQRKSALEVRKQQIDFMVPHIEKHRKALKNPRSDKMAMSFSYLDTLFDLQIENRNSSLTNPELVTLCFEFINGGIDTTAVGMVDSEVFWCVGPQPLFLTLSFSEAPSALHLFPEQIIL
nr:cytochrome p450 77a3 [Quercus suber]